MAFEQTTHHVKKKKKKQTTQTDGNTVQLPNRKQKYPQNEKYENDGKD